MSTAEILKDYRKEKPKFQGSIILFCTYNAMLEGMPALARSMLWFLSRRETVQRTLQKWRVLASYFSMGLVFLYTAILTEVGTGNSAISEQQDESVPFLFCFSSTGFCVTPLDRQSKLSQGQVVLKWYSVSQHDPVERKEWKGTRWTSSFNWYF